MLCFHKKANFGFVILSPTHNLGLIKSTTRSIRNRYDVQCICVVGVDTTEEQLNEINTILPACKGKETITSLMNTSFKSGHPEWNILIMEGTAVQPNINKKYNHFYQDEQDIFYPISASFDRQGKMTKVYSSFEDSSLNGLCMHQKTFKAAGKFEDGELQVSKFLWAVSAQEKGARLKGVVGVKMS